MEPLTDDLVMQARGLVMQVPGGGQELVMQALLSEIQEVKLFEKEVRDDVPAGFKVIPDALQRPEDADDSRMVDHTQTEMTALRKNASLLQAYILVLEALGEEDVPTIPDTDEESRKYPSASLDELKSQVCTTISSIEELSLDTQNIHEQYVQKLQTLQEKIRQMEGDQVKYKEVCARRSALPEDLAGVRSEEEALLVQAELEAKLAMMVEEDNLLKRERSEAGEQDLSGQSIEQLKAELLQLDSKLDQAYETFSCEQEQLCSEASHLEALLETVHELSGTESVHIEGSTVVVCFAKPITLPCIDDTDNEAKKDASLTLTVKFGKRRGRSCITGGDVDLRDLDISDLVTSAVYYDDVAYLVNSVNARWQHQVHLHTEIELLRQHYALDWLPEESCVRVLYGEGGSIVCTLKVPCSYPHEGSVSLQQMSGLAGQGSSLEQYYVENAESASLAQWLQHLHTVTGNN